MYADRVVNMDPELAEQLECSVCLGLVRDPRKIPGCRHIFCYYCVAMAANKVQKLYRCPTCRVTGNKLETDHLALNVMENIKVEIDL